MQRELHGTHSQVALSLAVYPLGFGLIPLVTAALSEEFGRRPLYLITSFIFEMMHIGIAL
jgi:MFS family permease